MGSSDLGFGFRAVSDEIVAYSHSNEISKNSLKQSSENLKSTLKSVKGIYNHEIPKSNKKYYENINPIEQKSIEIIRSGGETLTDIRPLIRFNVTVMLEKNG